MFFSSCYPEGELCEVHPRREQIKERIVLNSRFRFKISVDFRCQVSNAAPHRPASQGRARHVHTKIENIPNSWHHCFPAAFLPLWKYCLVLNFWNFQVVIQWGLSDIGARFFLRTLLALSTDMLFKRWLLLRAFQYQIANWEREFLKKSHALKV